MLDYGYVKRYPCPHCSNGVALALLCNMLMFGTNHCHRRRSGPVDHLTRLFPVLLIALVCWPSQITQYRFVIRGFLLEYLLLLFLFLLLLLCIKIALLQGYS